MPALLFSMKQYIFFSYLSKRQDSNFFCAIWAWLKPLLPKALPRLHGLHFALCVFYDVIAVFGHLSTHIVIQIAFKVAVTGNKCRS